MKDVFTYLSVLYILPEWIEGMDSTCLAEIKGKLTEYCAKYFNISKESIFWKEGGKSGKHMILVPCQDLKHISSEEDIEIIISYLRGITIGLFAFYMNEDHVPFYIRKSNMKK